MFKAQVTYKVVKAGGQAMEINERDSLGREALTHPGERKVAGPQGIVGVHAWQLHISHSFG